ncbi:hypothetical protein CLU81_1204 [Flavobacterium sp. 9]|uniref:hypothetical protein n=1 Tax=Flavobacterium sp. 9 TaxID=2035198 RepID=UPI000C410B1F|nr:hypothetical protein [Flavobacterium sp. 9]PIF30757.1 hypothetical protein CLU81_1204 [Flavobacterium sp. 9]
MMGYYSIYPNVIDYLSTTYANPVGIAYDVTGNRIAIVEFKTKVSFIDATTFKVLNTILASSLDLFIASIGFDSVNNRFFVGSDNVNGKVHIISGIDYSVTLNAIYVPTESIYRDFRFDYSTDRMFISCYGAASQPISKISVHKISDLTLITSFDADKASGIEIDTTARKFYVAGHTSANIKVYDLDTYSLLNTITGSGDFALSLVYGITQDPSNSDYMIIQDYNLNKLCLLQKSTNTIIKQIKGFTSARLSVFINDKIYVTLGNTTNRVAVIKKFY